MPRFRPPRGGSSPETRVSTAPALARPLLTAVAIVALTMSMTAQGRIEVLNSRGEVTPLAGVIILSETLSQVQFRRLDSTRTETRDSSRVVRVVYGKGSPTYQNAQAVLQQGDLRNAVALLTTASNETDPPWMAAVALLELADVQSRQGADQIAAARATLKRFRDTYPEHRLLPEALLQEAEYASAAGDRTAADAAVRAVLDLAGASRISADWAIRAQLGLGRALLAGGDGKGAGEAFADAEQAAASANLGDRTDLAPVVAELALAARSGVGASMLASGDVAGARTYFTRLQKDGAGDVAVAAAAANGLAEANFMERKLKDAQLGFARVAVTAAAVPEEHAKALYFLGQCAESLAAEGKERNGQAIAREYYQEVQARYPGSHWARLAQESIP